MKSNKDTMRTKVLPCPACHKPIKEHADLSRCDFEQRNILSSRPGDLTECPHCLAMLEFQGDPLVLRRPSKDRIKRFNELTRREPRQGQLAELLAYVRRYRRMPVPPSY